MRVQVIGSVPETKDTSAEHVAVDGRVACCADQTHYLTLLNSTHKRMACQCET